MLIDASLTIAYKCSSCGTFKFFNISLFKLLCKKECTLACHCSKTGIVIKEEKTTGYKISIPCIGCGDSHTFALSRKEVLNRDITAFCCPVTGIQQCFIGTDKEVRRTIDRLEKELDELINMFGYDNYFKNTQVMFDSLNKIHDIAEQGNLLCECGNNDIELILLPDKIQLRCKNCPGKKDIHAVSNEDLKEMLIKQQIFLMDDQPGFEIQNEGRFIRKTDRNV